VHAVNVIKMIFSYPTVYVWKLFAVYTAYRT